jgi:hypothetical protein
MPQRNSLGVVSGLVFVAAFLVMLATCGQATRIVHSPFSKTLQPSYELAVYSRAVLIPAVHPSSGAIRMGGRPAFIP